MRVRPDLLDTVRALSPGFDAFACLNCGVCSALCPLGIEHLPRELFRYVVLGMKEELLQQQETVFSCLLCKMCEVSCPAGVHITENVRTLRHYFDRQAFGL